MPEHVPLTILLSWAWIAHTIEIDNAFEAASSEKVARHVSPISGISPELINESPQV